MHISKLQLRHDAQDLTQDLDALLADAKQLAASISLGAHGRRRAGPGEEFWQYRMATSTDAATNIDWRRSARSDDHFIRQQEWQNTQSIHLWVDRSASMMFRSDGHLKTKAYAGSILALSIAILLLKAGEKVGLSDVLSPPKQGLAQIHEMASSLCNLSLDQEFLPPSQKEMKKGQKAVFISDFFGDWDEIVDRLNHTARQGVDGYLMQVLDPAEQEFPYKGRTVLLSMNKTQSFETQKAQSLRDEYLEKLKERKAALKHLSTRTGWQYFCYQTSAPILQPMMWLYAVLKEIR